MPIPSLKWLQKIDGLINLEVHNGLFYWDGNKPKLQCHGGIAAPEKSFKATLNNGSDPDHATVKIASGWVVHMGNPAHTYSWWSWADDTDNIELADTFNVIYAQYDADAETVIIDKQTGATESAALNAVDSTGTLIRYPLVCYDYDAGTFSATIVRTYHEGNITLVPVFSV